MYLIKTEQEGGGGGVGGGGGGLNIYFQLYLSRTK